MRAVLYANAIGLHADHGMAYALPVAQYAQLKRLACWLYRAHFTQPNNLKALF